MTSLIFGLLVMSVAGIGSTLGLARASNAALGVKAEKGAECPNLIVFALMPFSQTLYGLVILAMSIFLFKDKFPTGEDPLGIITTLIAGLFIGACIGGSAYFQGVVGARACDAVGKTNQGKAEAIMFMGSIETIAIFMMVMSIIGMFIVL